MLNGKNYCITPQNLPAHEFIGLKAKVVGSTDVSRKGIAGVVVDETKNVIVIESKKVVKKLPKSECEFEFALGNEKVKVDGKQIVGRPEDRPKIVWRKTHGKC